MSRNTFATLCLCAFCCLPALASAKVETWITSGKSMFPTLPVEKTPILVWTGDQAFACVTLGSIVVFSMNGINTTHRVIKVIAPGVFWTRGDNNALPDQCLCTVDTFRALVLTPLPRNSRSPMKTN